MTFAEGILKWSGFLQLNDTAILLVGDEFKLRLPDGPYSFPAPALIAFASGSVEVLAPVFLVLGLGTRFAGLVLLVMTCIVELTVPEGWPVHITWAAMALSIMTWGPGRFSPSLVHVGRAMGHLFVNGWIGVCRHFHRCADTTPPKTGDVARSGTGSCRGRCPTR